MIVSCGEPGTCPSPLHIVDDRKTFLGVYPWDGEINGRTLSLSAKVTRVTITEDADVMIHLRLNAAERRALAAELLKGLDN